MFGLLKQILEMYTVYILMGILKDIVLKILSAVFSFMYFLCLLTESM